MKVTDLFIYPIKSCRGIRLERAQMVARGFAADRRYMLVDGRGAFVSQRQRRELALVSVRRVLGSLGLIPHGCTLRARKSDAPAAYKDLNVAEFAAERPTSER